MTLAHESTLCKLCTHAVYIITAIRRGNYLICSKIRSPIQVEYILKNWFSDTRRFISIIICCWLVCSAHSCWYIRPLNQVRTLDSLMLIARCSPEPITLCPIRLILDFSPWLILSNSSEISTILLSLLLKQSIFIEIA